MPTTAVLPNPVCPDCGCKSTVMKRQASQSPADLADVSLHRMPSPLYRGASQAQDLPARADSRSSFNVQSRLLRHRDTTSTPKPVSPPDSRTHHQLLADRIPPA